MYSSNNHAHSNALTNHTAVKDGDENGDDKYQMLHTSDGLRLQWVKKPHRFLIIHKLNDNRVMESFHTLIAWLYSEKLCEIYVEETTYKELRNQYNGQACLDSVHHFDAHITNLTGIIDLVICLGGDGTLLHASSLFQKKVPPVMAFCLGTLGFLTPFPFENFRDDVTSVLNGQPRVTRRSRLEVVMVTSGTRSVQQGLNEVVVDRGSLPFLSNLDVYLNGQYVTTLAGDGVILSTPTGSTAYAMAVGASLIHPNVSCLLLAPISPHSLSFRPIVLPMEGVEVVVKLRPSPTHECGERQGPQVSVDGKAKGHLCCEQDEVRIKGSQYPLTSLCKSNEVSDWFSGLAEILHWNARSNRQKG